MKHKINLFSDVPISELPLDELPHATRTMPIEQLSPDHLHRLSLPPRTCSLREALFFALDAADEAVGGFEEETDAWHAWYRRLRQLVDDFVPTGHDIQRPR